jgi:hypothetical protein
MAKKRNKPVSFDAMVKFFMHAYNIPTKKDLDRLTERLDRIERLIVNAGGSKRRRGGTDSSADKPPAETASDIVWEVIRHYHDGVGIKEIQMQTGFGEKKLRNIIFRLHKLGKIKRKQRGVYIES